MADPLAAIEKSLMKISELEERTGIPRETIHYYIREGLLPAPIKKGLRLAYYDESYVSLIDLIKKLQEERYLPLAVIKNLFREQKYDVAELEKAFLSDLFGKTSSLRKVGLDKLRQDLKDRPIPPGYFQELCRSGLISQETCETGEGEEQPSELDLKLAQLCLRGEKLGFTIEKLRTIAVRVEEIVQLERDTLIEMLRHKESPKDFVAGMKDRQQFMEEFLLYQRARFIQRAVEDFLNQAASARVHASEDLIALPSEAFRKRYRIDDQVDRMRADAEQSRDERELEHVAWALFLAGRHEELFAMDDRRRTDRFKLAVAYAKAVQGEAEPAVKWVERAVKKNAEDGFFLGLAGGLYLIFASSAEGFIESTIWVSKGMELLEESARCEPEEPLEAMCVNFLRARTYLTLPEPFGKTAEGRKELERILQMLQGKGREKLNPRFEGELEIFEVSIHFLLGEAARLSGETKKAVAHYRRVIELDPAGNFGGKAFVQLGEIEGK